jgi:flagellar biosynthesis chaperone FliJ
MKRFESKLQAVLAVRQRAEQKALEIYSLALKARQNAARAVAEAELALAEARRLWLNQMTDGCAALRVAQSLAFCHLLEARKAQCDLEAQHVELEVQDASRAMLQARQQREAVETYLSGQRARHDREMQKEELKSLEELIQHRLAPVLSWQPAPGKTWN